VFAVCVAVAAVVGVHDHQAHQAAVHADRAAQAAHAQAVQAANARSLALQREKEEIAAGLTLVPKTGTSGVEPDAVVSVKASVGTLQSVVALDQAGQPLAGGITHGGTVWQSKGTLQPGTVYDVKAEVAGPNGITVSKSSTFKVLVPTFEVTATVWPTTDMSVGVGQPIVVRFDQPIYTLSSQRAVLSHFTIAESKPVPGGWYWFSPYELHFRPETFWPTGEVISVSGNLNGWNAGSGEWGTGLVSETFGIGDARISYANLQTDQMTVTLDGKTVGVYPISGGRPQYPTMNGIHIVLDRESVVHMVSSTVGIPVNSPNGYDEYVYNDVHISDSGEYVHAAPWSVADQGVTNVSHGCINLSSANSLTFFNFSRVGDIVEVTGSPRPPLAGDHGVMDWTTPWSQWTPAAVVQLRSTTTDSYQRPQQALPTSRSLLAGRDLQAVPADAAAKPESSTALV
jgi:lipoprotein-anchoring transpeptidase ErfK/SrfK